VISLPGIGVGLIASFILPQLTIFKFSDRVLLEEEAFSWLPLFISGCSKGGNGGGDVKLLAMIGSLLGWEKP